MLFSNLWHHIEIKLQSQIDWIYFSSNLHFRSLMHFREDKDKSVN